MEQTFQLKVDCPNSIPVHNSAIYPNSMRSASDQSLTMHTVQSSQHRKSMVFIKHFSLIFTKIHIKSTPDRKACTNKIMLKMSYFASWSLGLGRLCACSFITCPLCQFGTKNPGNVGAFPMTMQGRYRRRYRSVHRFTEKWWLLWDSPWHIE